MAIQNGKDIQELLSEEIDKFVKGEIKSDRLNAISKATAALMAPAMAKLKAASINKEKVSIKFLDCDL